LKLVFHPGVPKTQKCESGAVWPICYLIAGSPDGIVSCNCCPKAVLEIKCPFTLADKSVKDGWKNLDYLNMNDKQILELTQKHPYYTQLQG
jgi:hypothetical protein